MKKKHICLILPEGLPVPATMGGAIETLMSNLIAQNEIHQKIKLTVFASYEKKAYQQTKQYQHTDIILIKKNCLYYLIKTWFKIIRLFVKDFDKIVYNELVLNQIKNKNIDYVIVEQGHTSAFKSYLRYFEKKQLILHFHHNGSSTPAIDQIFGRYIGVSEFVKNTFQDSSTITDCQVLKNGIDIKPFIQVQSDSAESQVLKNKYGIKSNDIVLLFCGRIVPEKGILELVKAIKAINDEHLKLIIVGSANFADTPESEFSNKIKQLIKDLGDRVIMTGYIHNSKIAKIHHISNIFVFPSTCEEAAGMSAIEAMAAGLPIIATKFGGIPEYVHPDNIFIDRCSDDKLVQELKKAVVKLAHDEKLRRTLSKNNQRHAQQFSAEQYYANFIEIIRSYR
ncbi:MAG: glycosyltransferase family 4 protein [Candidatus Saccharibacteria bacterium]|nr:glycosyltransferase family 4 protein [Candidatus Saccharibacteria bacterium]